MITLNHSESDAFLTTSRKQDSHFSHANESHSGMLDQFWYSTYHTWLGEVTEKKCIIHPLTSTEGSDFLCFICPSLGAKYECSFVKIGLIDT